MARKKLIGDTRSALRKDVRERLKVEVPLDDLARELARKYDVTFQFAYNEVCTVAACRPARTLAEQRETARREAAEAGERLTRTVDAWARLDRPGRIRALVRTAARMARGAAGEEVLERSEALAQKALDWCDRPGDATAHAARVAASKSRPILSDFEKAEAAEPGEASPDVATDSAWERWALQAAYLHARWALGRVVIDLRIAAVRLAAGEPAEIPPSFIALCADAGLSARLDVAAYLDALTHPPPDPV